MTVSLVAGSQLRRPQAELARGHVVFCIAVRFVEILSMVLSLLAYFFTMITESHCAGIGLDRPSRWAGVPKGPLAIVSAAGNYRSRKRTGQAAKRRS